MQQLTEEQKREMREKYEGVFPDVHPVRDTWLRALDAVVRVITLGKGRVVPRGPHRAPIKWDGIIR